MKYYMIYLNTEDEYDIKALKEQFKESKLLLINEIFQVEKTGWEVSYNMLKKKYNLQKDEIMYDGIPKNHKIIILVSVIIWFYGVIMV